MLAAALLCVLILALLPKGEGATASAPLAGVPEAAPLPAPEGLRLAVASDTHFDPDNTDKSAGYCETAYNMELLDALIFDARQQGAQLLLLTGDLCNSGRINKHEALIEKLHAAEAAGLPVCVLPGNHDLAPLTQTEFAALYADFGYDEAYSRDGSSLSYSVLRDDMLLLMMDTAGYRPGAIDLPGAPTRENTDGFLTDATLRWAEEQLKTARALGVPVLAAGHYNLLPEISRTPGSGYCVENGERFAELLRDYGVKLYLSGHMHLRAVYEEDGLTEQLTECLVAYPTAYTVLDLTADTLQVSPRRVDVDAWAAAAGQDDPVLLRFAEWQQEQLYLSCRETVLSMAKKNPLTEEETESAVRFFYTLMDAYWRGALAEEREAIEQMEGYAPFFRAAEGYSYGWWLKDLLETVSPKLKGYALGLMIEK